MNHVEIEDLKKFVFIENPVYSPDGTYLAFIKAMADEKKNSYHRDLYLVKDGEVVQYTAEKNTSIMTWADPSHLIITGKSERPGATALYRIGVNGGEAMPFMEIPFPVSKLYCLQDGRYALIGSVKASDPDQWKKEEEKQDQADCTVVDELPYWMNGEGYINGDRNCLFIMDGKEIRRITDVDGSIDETAADGNLIYYSFSKRDPSIGLYQKLYCYDASKDKITPVYDEWTHSITNLSVINDTLYFQASDMKKYGVNETGKISVVKDGRIVTVCDPQRSMYNSVASDIALGGGKQKAVMDGYLYSLETHEDHTRIVRYDTEGNKEIIHDENETIFSMDASNGKVAYVASGKTALQTLYEMDLITGKVTKLTDFNDAYVRNTMISCPERIDYESEGKQMHGWVIRPIEYEKGRKYPCILDVHGGPRAVYGSGFFHEMQVWAARGYFVCFTNIAGSDGRGDDFADIRDDYGGEDYRDLMKFMDRVLEVFEDIDETRLCETGGSYGGFMTNWIITHTDRFCCAASQRSVVNWISMSLTSDIGPDFETDQCGAQKRWCDEDYEKMWNHSPLKYIANAHTPTLFIHSDQDYRCPLSEGMQMMQGLAVRGVETRMCIFHGENHELSRSGKPANRIRRLKEITDWFDKHTRN